MVHIGVQRPLLCRGVISSSKNAQASSRTNYLSSNHFLSQLCLGFGEHEPRGETTNISRVLLQERTISMRANIRTEFLY